MEDLIPHVEACFNQIHRWSLLRLHIPYTLHTNLHDVPSDDKNKCARKPMYTFVANMKYIASQWLWHVLIFVGGAASCLFQIIFETNTFSKVSIFVVLIIVLTFDTGFAYIQHLKAEQFTYFLNQLLRFEISYAGENICTTST